MTFLKSQSTNMERELCRFC